MLLGFLLIYTFLIYSLDNKDVIESDYNYITKFYDAKQPDIYFGSLPINSLAYKIAKQETINDLLKEDDDVKKNKENEDKIANNNDGEEENVVKQKESRYFNVNLSIKCYNCGEIGHVSKFCPNEKVVICSKCNKKGHMFYACPEVKCFRCNKIGHKANDCVEKISVVCNICNHNGHNQIQCLNRQDYSIKLMNKTDRKKIVCDDCGVKGKHFLCKFDFINLDGKFDNCVSESSFSEEEHNEEQDNNEEYCSRSNSHQHHNDSLDKVNRKENIQLLKKKIKKRLSDSEDTEKLIVSKLKKKINSRKRYDSNMSNLTETNINKIEDLEPGELDDNEVDKYRKNSNISIPNINAIDDDDAYTSKNKKQINKQSKSNKSNKNEENKDIENYCIDENDSDYDNYVSLGLIEDSNRKKIDLNKIKKEIISNNIKKIKKNIHSSDKSNSESSFNINDTTEFGNGNFFGEFLCPMCATKHTFKESCKVLTNSTNPHDHIRNRYAGQNNKQYSNYNKDNRDYRDNRDNSYNNHRSNNNSYHNTNYENNYHSTNNYNYTRNNNSNYNQNSHYNNYNNNNNYSKFNDKYNNNSSKGNKYNVNDDINRFNNYYVNTSNNNINSFNNNNQKRTINRNWK